MAMCAKVVCEQRVIVKYASQASTATRNAERMQRGHLPKGLMAARIMWRMVISLYGVALAKTEIIRTVDLYPVISIDEDVASPSAV